MIADSEEKLQQLVDGFGEDSRKYELSVNTHKAEVMGLTKRKGQLDVVVSL